MSSQSHLNTHRFQTTNLCLRSNKTETVKEKQAFGLYFSNCLELPELLLEEQAKETSSGLSSNSPFVRQSQEYQKDTSKPLFRWKTTPETDGEQVLFVPATCCQGLLLIPAGTGSDTAEDSLHFFRQLTGVMRSMRKYHKSSQETKGKKSSRTDSTLYSR